MNLFPHDEDMIELILARFQFQFKISEAIALSGVVLDQIPNLGHLIQEVDSPNSEYLR